MVFVGAAQGPLLELHLAQYFMFVFMFMHSASHSSSAVAQYLMFIFVGAAQGPPLEWHLHLTQYFVLMFVHTVLYIHVLVLAHYLMFMFVDCIGIFAQAAPSAGLCVHVHAQSFTFFFGSYTKTHVHVRGPHRDLRLSYT
eukprot:scaffold41432_cov19-Tisochrysis_lutea.AAC.1